MVEWSITAVLKTAALRGAGGSNPSLSAHKVTFGLPFFRYVRGVSPHGGVLSVAPLCESVPSGRARIPLSPQGSHEQNACETFFFYYPNTLPSQTRRTRPDKEEKTKQGEGESIEEKEAKEGGENKEKEVKAGRKQGEEKEWYRQKKNDSQSSLEVIFCTPSGARTLDPLIKSQLLYQLS